MDLRTFVQLAIDEDIPENDLTTDSLGFKERPGEAHLVAKEDLILSGKEAFETAMKILDPKVQLHWHFKEGDLILNKQVACVIQGDLLEILKAERTALNFLGHLSGIATLTRCYTERLKGLDTKLLDTRKTLPGFRKLEKQAVVHGGGHNHRMNLSDAVMIKENHINVCGSLREAVVRVRQKTNAKIELETKNLEEVEMAVEIGVDRIMLDNMDNETTAEALKIIPSTIETEASGNMTIDRLRSVAELGVDYISVGAITHSAPCADFSLLFQWDR